MVLVKVNRH